MEMRIATFTVLAVIWSTVSGSSDLNVIYLDSSVPSEVNYSATPKKIAPLPTLLPLSTSSSNSLLTSPRTSFKSTKFTNSSQLIENVKSKLVSISSSLSQRRGRTPPSTIFNRLPTWETREKPWISLSHSPNVTSYLGRTASLRCRIHNRRNYTISWIRHRDLHLLTVDRYTYTSDQRFKAIHESSSGDWVLIITSLQSRDRGEYECQISTTPPVGHFISLHIVEPETRLLGGSDLHINLGSTLNLTCLVLYHPKPPDINWLHQGERIEYTSTRGGISVVTESAEEATRSSLLIQKATEEDAGNYTCQPIGGASTSTRVHVLSDELRAAMQGSASHFLQERYNNHCILLTALPQIILQLTQR